MGDMRKIAFLGSHTCSKGGNTWEAAKSLAKWVVQQPDCQVVVMSPGGEDERGIAVAAAHGVREVYPDDESRGGRLKVWRDTNKPGRQFYWQESGQGDFWSNLRNLVVGSDVWVVFPGEMGTVHQLLTILLCARRESIDLRQKKLVVMAALPLEKISIPQWTNLFINQFELGGVEYMVTPSLQRLKGSLGLVLGLPEYAD